MEAEEQEEQEEAEEQEEEEEEQEELCADRSGGAAVSSYVGEKKITKMHCTCGLASVAD